MKKIFSLFIIMCILSCKSEYQDKLELMTAETKRFHKDFASNNQFEIDIMELNGIKYDTININDLDSMRYYILYDKFQYFKAQLEANNKILEIQRKEIQERKEKGATEASQAAEIEEYNTRKTLSDSFVDTLKSIKSEQDLLIQKIEQRIEPDKIYRMQYYMNALVKHGNGALERINDTLNIYFDKEYQMVKDW